MNTENLVVVIGGTGSIGGAIAEQIRSLGFKEIIKIGRMTNPSIDFNDEQTIKNAAEFIKKIKKKLFQFYLMLLEFYMMKKIIKCQRRL